jgi:hypothetical protein
MMRYPIFIALLSMSQAVQGQANCTTQIAIDVDARCSCIKDPNSQVCAMAKAGFYDGKMKPINLGSVTGSGMQSEPPQARPQPARPQQARVVPLAHKDYLRFLQPNAHLIAGFDFGKVFSSPELVAGLFGQGDDEASRTKVMGALKEMDHLWMSYASPTDFVLLMTGKFEQGVAAGMFYAQGIQPVFLSDAHAMMVGPEPSIQAALARLAKPAVAGGWVTRRARELSKDHETWIVNEPPATNQGALQTIRQFSLGVRLSGEATIDGEAVADSEANAEKIGVWIDQMKAALRQKTGVGVLDALTVERNGSTLRFAAKDDPALTGEAGKAALNSEFGVELYSVIMAGFPGVPSSSVAGDKLLAVKAGMKREEVLGLLGRPISVSTIQGLDLPRETWTYQVPFGKQFTMRLDGGVVTVPPR